MSDLELWLIRFAYIAFILFFIIGWLFYLRSHYAKAVVGKVYCEFITKEGNGYARLLPIENGVIKVEPTKKKPGKVYFLRDVATYNVDFPPVPRIFSIIQTKAKKCIIDEECAEVISNRSGKMALSPVLLYNLISERFTQQSMEASMRADKGEVPKKVSRFSWSKVVWIILALALIAGGAWVVQNIDLLKAASGVQ